MTEFFGRVLLQLRAPKTPRNPFGHSFTRGSVSWEKHQRATVAGHHPHFQLAVFLPGAPKPTQYRKDQAGRLRRGARVDFKKAFDAAEGIYQAEVLAQRAGRCEG